MGWQYIDFRREQLYEQVWSEPVTKVAKRYAISDVGLRKICLGLEVPLPPVGYWAKLAAGKTVKRSPLKPTKGPTTYRQSRYVDEDFDARYRESLEKDSPDKPPTPSLPMRTSLDDCLPLVKRVAKILEGKRRDTEEWRFCDGAGLMWVSASRANSLRAALLLNLVLESLKAAGYAISADAKSGTRAFVTVLQFNFSFRIREKSRRVPVPLTREQRQKNEDVGFDHFTQQYEHEPIGEFELVATEPDGSLELAKIGDSRASRVETRIPAFVERLRELAIRHQVQGEIAEERRVIAEAETEKQRRQAEVRRKALEQLKHVEDLAAQLERANRLRRLADEFENQGLSAADGVVDAKWIRRAADWLDPTVVRYWADVDGRLEGNSNSNFGPA